MAVSIATKRLGCEADHSLVFNAEVKNAVVITPHPFMFSWHDA
jgi:hypothetical protein